MKQAFTIIRVRERISSKVMALIRNGAMMEGGDEVYKSSMEEDKDGES